MKIEVCYLPWHYRHLKPAPGIRTINIVIDVLRATSTIITGCAHGATGFLPVAGVEEARTAAARHPGAVLAGERGGTSPAGFMRGNSPREFCDETVRGRPVVLTTTNGTRAFLAVPEKEAAWAMAFLNLAAVVQRIREQAPGRLRILCAGTGGDFSLEDALVAGFLLKELAPEHPLVSLSRAYAFYDKAALMGRTRNGRRLREIGLREDIDWCAQENAYSVVPGLQADGWIRSEF